MSNPELRAQVAKCDYNLLSSIGTGMNGTVYKVASIATGAKAALKVIAYQAGVGIPSGQEIDIPSRISHPHIMQNIAYITEVSCNFSGVGMINILGDGTLEDVDRNLPLDQKITIIYKIATGLEFLHRNGIFHFDIKPTNIIMHGLEPQIIDFGLALYVDHQDVVLDLGIRGTVPLVPPERSGSGGPASYYTDVWSYGLTVFSFIVSNELVDANEPPIEVLYNLISNNDVLDMFKLKRFLSGLRQYFATTVSPVNDVLVEFFSEILSITPEQRPHMEDILESKLFVEQRKILPIHGIQKRIVGDPICVKHIMYSPTVIPRQHQSVVPYPDGGLFYNLFNLLLNVFIESVGNALVRCIFYAVDMLYRSVAIAPASTMEHLYTLCLACITLSIKIDEVLPEDIKNIIDTFDRINGKYPRGKFDLEKVIIGEDNLIVTLEGLLYSSPFYDMCDTVDDVKYVWNRLTNSGNGGNFIPTDPVQYFNEDFFMGIKTDLKNLPVANGRELNNNMLIKDLLGMSSQ